jgi:hypothetical protein
MRIPAILVLTGATLAACSSPQQTAGTAAGVAAGAVVVGPIGAVAGGAIGAVVTAPGRPGFCYRSDRYGRMIYNRYGQPRLVRC